MTEHLPQQRPHSHEHVPTEPHSHQSHDHEPHNMGAGQGAVLLDIGDGVGALVLGAAAELAGAEIEISPVGQDDRRTHVAVLARPGTTATYAAVYPSLVAGLWNLWYPNGPVALTVEIRDGEVTEARWPG